MRRREFILGIGGILALAEAACGQTSGKRVVGFLSAGSPEPLASFAAAFVSGLSEAGLVEEQHFTVEYRWARGDPKLLPGLAAELVDKRVDVIAVFGTPSARIAKEVIKGSPIPMVFANGSDPVADGLVKSMSRPEGNVTGITSIAASIVPKRLELLRTSLSKSGAIAVFINPNNPLSVAELNGTMEAAASSQQPIVVAKAKNASEVDDAFKDFARGRVSGVIITTDLFFYGYIGRFAELLKQANLPAIAPLREFALAGGLMSYGASIADAYRQAGHYAGRVLKGEKPADLPIQQPSKFEYVVNLRTAKAMALDLPAATLALADEVIE